MLRGQSFVDGYILGHLKVALNAQKEFKTIPNFGLRSCEDAEKLVSVNMIPETGNVYDEENLEAVVSVMNDIIGQGKFSASLGRRISS